MKNILVVDDDPLMVKLISRILSRKGYRVLESSNGQDALRILYKTKPDLVLLDVVMPGMDGWQTCSRIRDISSSLPVIMLTGQRTTEEDVVRGLDFGADDYLIKPVGNKELVARVQAMLRRAEMPSSMEEKGKEAVFNDGYLAVDIVRRTVTVNGERVKLTPIEFRLLAFLMRNTGRILTHQQLLEKVWGWEYVDDLDYVRIYILHLRKKLEHEPSLPRYIITEPGVGYYFKKTA